MFEPCVEQVDELWLHRCNPDEKMNARTNRKRTLHDKNIIIADLRGKLRVERKKSRGIQVDLAKSEKVINVSGIRWIKYLCFRKVLIKKM